MCEGKHTFPLPSCRPGLSKLKFNRLDFLYFLKGQVQECILTYLQEGTRYSGWFILRDFSIWAWFHLKPKWVRFDKSFNFGGGTVLVIKPMPLAHSTPHPPRLSFSFLTVLVVGNRSELGPFWTWRHKKPSFFPPELRAGDTAPAPRLVSSKGGAAGLLIAPSFPGYVRVSRNQNIRPRLPLLHRD